MAIVGLWVQNGLFGTPYGLRLGAVSKDVSTVESCGLQINTCGAVPRSVLCDPRPQSAHHFERHFWDTRYTGSSAFENELGVPRMHAEPVAGCCKGYEVLLIRF